MTDLTLVIAILAVIFLAIRIISGRRIDSRFGCNIEGGRCGDFLIDVGGCEAKMYYEVGSGVDYIIFDDKIQWSDGRRSSQDTNGQAKQVIRSWAAARGKKLHFVSDD